jgi:maleylacetoacetate isomerase/maleylpyruvate isomerase
MLKLYSYFRSSASYRARIALHYKELPFEYVPVHLVKDGGRQNSPEYRKINPMGHVPALDHDGRLVAETVAIVQYLDDVFPERPLFPQDAYEKALVLQICEIVNSGIQPLQNLKVTNYLERDLGLSKPASNEWVQHWVRAGLENLEKLLTKTSGSFAVAGFFSAADAFIIPQCFSARRFGVKIEDYPHIARVEAAGLKLPAVQKAHPEQQPDYAP